MKNLTSDEVDMCLDVLRFGEIIDVELRTEAHLMPTWCEGKIRSIVERLKPLVDRKDVAAFSWGLVGMDAVMNAILRPQDLLGMMPGHVYMMRDRALTGEMCDIIEAVLPLIYKNGSSLNASLEGGECCHIKDPRMHKWLVVMLVILRPLMREHLNNLNQERKKDPDAEELTLCDELGPFDKDGKCFTVGKLQSLFKYLGEHLIGLGHWGYNILRTSSMTDTAFLALAQDESVEAPWVLRKLQACRMSKQQYLRHYNAVVPRALRCNPNSIDSQAAGIDGLHRLRAQCNTGSPGASSEASRLELEKEKDETKRLPRKMDEQSKRIQQLEQENAQLLEEVQKRGERIQQLKNENNQPKPRTNDKELRKENEDDQESPVGINAENGKVGMKRGLGKVDRNREGKRMKQSKSGRGGENRDNRSKPIGKDVLNLVREMHGCLKKMHESGVGSVDSKVKCERGTFENWVKNGSVISTSASFSDGVKVKFQAEQPDLAGRFYKIFSARGQLKRCYQNLGLTSSDE